MIYHSVWTLEPTHGGVHILNLGQGKYKNQAIQLFSGRFSTYGVGEGNEFIFNIYEVQ